MIKDDYRAETNLDVYDNIERGAYCNDYVHWLEEKLQKRTEVLEELMRVYSENGQLLSFNVNLAREVLIKT